MFGSNKKPRTLLMRGIEALSRREYSRLELYRKLMRSLAEGETADDVEGVLRTLEERGYLSDERYAVSRVRGRASRYGNRRLAMELNMMGVDPETVTEALNEVDDEYARARALWEKRFGSPPEDRRERDRQVRFLASRGFGFDIINRVVHAEVEDFDDF